MECKIFLDKSIWGVHLVLFELPRSLSRVIIFSCDFFRTYASNLSMCSLLKSFKECNWFSLLMNIVCSFVWFLFTSPQFYFLWCGMDQFIHKIQNVRTKFWLVCAPKFLSYNTCYKNRLLLFNPLVTSWMLVNHFIGSVDCLLSDGWIAVVFTLQTHPLVFFSFIYVLGFFGFQPYVAVCFISFHVNYAYSQVLWYKIPLSLLGVHIVWEQYFASKPLIIPP